MQITNPYLSPSYVQSLLRRLNIHPTRDMGQNFLIDRAALATIVEAAHLVPTDVVIEVGPGPGVLTWELLERVGNVIAVELDKRLAEHVRDTCGNTFKTRGNLHVVQGNILKLSPSTLLSYAALPDRTDTSVPSYKVVANLPYAITSPVLRHFLEHAVPPQVMVILMQWEVAERIIAAPGDLSILAHAVQLYAQPEIIARVPADSFLPRPAVASAIVRLTRHAVPAIPTNDIPHVFRILKAGFSQPRKKLSNSLPAGLASAGTPIPRDRVVHALKQAGVSPDRRAETVSLHEWYAISMSFDA